MLRLRLRLTGLRSHKSNQSNAMGALFPNENSILKVRLNYLSYCQLRAPACNHISRALARPSGRIFSSTLDAKAAPSD